LEDDWTLTKEGEWRAREMHKKAIALDPSYAAAYASLAWSYLSSFEVQYDTDPKTPKRVEELAQRAIDLDDNNAIAYTALGELHAIEGPRAGDC
jgi:hypothetical protein